MAEDTNGGGAAQPQPQAQQQPSLKIVAQYVKDLSFENPGAPASLVARGQSPNINISVGVQARPVQSGGESGQADPNSVEVELRIEARAVDGSTVLFAVELVYAGIFRMEGVSQENAQALTLVECPRLLFPFARQIVAEASRNGGFPPLMIDPIDFVALYRQQLAKQAQPPPAPPTSPTN